MNTGRIKMNNSEQLKEHAYVELVKNNSEMFRRMYYLGSYTYFDIRKLSYRSVLDKNADVFKKIYEICSLNTLYQDTFRRFTYENNLINIQFMYNNFPVVIDNEIFSIACIHNNDHLIVKWIISLGIKVEFIFDECDWNFSRKPDCYNNIMWMIDNNIISDNALNNLFVNGWLTAEIYEKILITGKISRETIIKAIYHNRIIFRGKHVIMAISKFGILSRNEILHIVDDILSKYSDTDYLTYADFIFKSAKVRELIVNDINKYYSDKEPNILQQEYPLLQENKYIKSNDVEETSMCVFQIVSRDLVFSVKR